MPAEERPTDCVMFWDRAKVLECADRLGLLASDANGVFRFTATILGIAYEADTVDKAVIWLRGYDAGLRTSTAELVAAVSGRREDEDTSTAH